MNVFAVITNFNLYEKAVAALDVAERLLDLGAHVLLAETAKEKVLRMHRARREYTYLPQEELFAAAECIVVLGGDGSLLDAARRAAPQKKPLLGVNMGHLGYMTELEMNELDLLARLTKDDFTIDERAMLSVGVYTENGKRRAESFALNDAVISNGSVARIVDIELYEGDRLICAYRADGVIVATPTGSTAYSMSAGGPLTDPHLPCLLVTPVCPHSLSARPILFRDDAVLGLKNICKREKMLYLTADGRVNFEIFPGDTVRVTRAEMTARFVRLRQGTFYTRLQQKMNVKEY